MFNPFKPVYFSKSLEKLRKPQSQLRENLRKIEAQAK